VWSNLTADESTGLVFGATGDANRAVHGSNLYCNSIVALDAQTGKLKWFHQLVHHDASDWDMPTPPILVDVKINGRPVPAVLQTGKLHFVYMFDRVTGKPLYEFVEKPVHRSGTPDDENWPTQPIPVKTPPTGRLARMRLPPPDEAVVVRVVALVAGAAAGVAAAVPARSRIGCRAAKRCRVSHHPTVDSLQSTR